MRLGFIALWAAALGAPAVLSAQVGSTTDIITGKVTGPPPAAQPIAGATVVVTSVDTHISRSRTTNNDGRYTVVFPDGGGQYRVEVRYVGYAPAQVILSRQADEDRLVANISMNTTVPTLATVTTRARANPGRDASNAGGTGLTITPSQLERLPVDASDLATIATLAPGVIGIGATDTTASAFSVAGQRQSLNATTVDGVTFAGTSVPTEAVRNIRVVTNSYDVSRGQFSGGQIATTTRGGTNNLAGSYAFTARNTAFSFGTQGPAAFGQLRDQIQGSGGFGGPIIRDRLFTFSAVQFGRRSDDLVSLLNADPTTLGQLGITRDTATAFIAHVRRLGLPATGATVPNDRALTSIVAFQRFDYLLNDDQTLTLRGDFRASAQDGSRISVFSLPTSGTANSNAGGGLLLALTSHFGEATINDFRAYVSHTQTSVDPYLRIPAGRVTVVPESPDTESTQPLGFGVSSLSFAGNPGVSQRTFNDYIEATNEISLLPGEGAHRIKLGGLLHVARFGQNLTPNQEGVFTYQSLAAFEADSPATYTRELNVQNTQAHSVAGAVYLGDAWRSGQFQLTYGARLEGSAYSGAPAYNPTIDSLFHRRTDDWPSEIHASPRVGFTWFIGGGGGGGGGGAGRGGGGGGGGFRMPVAIVRGGIGEFRASVPQSLFPSLQSATGAAGAEEQLVCVGPQVPTPQWAGYYDGTVQPPTECNPTSVPIFPIDSLGIGARSVVTTFAPDFEAPRAWRGSLGISRRVLSNRVNLSLDGTYARGVALFGVTDLNLKTAPGFTLANEANRPVYVPPGAIDPATGTAAFGASRLHPQDGQVLSLNSNLQSDTRQITASANGFTDHGLIYQLSYSLSHVRDQSSFAGGSAAYGFASPTTGGNPNVVPFGTSDLQREHQIVGTLTYPLTALIEITAVAQLSSGTPYSPLVNGDVNADGVSRNDRAFIFDPANPATDPAVAAAMRSLLNSGSGRIRDCLRSQVGQVAERNSCDGPWTTSLNWQLNIRPNSWGLDRRLTISVQILNTLTGLDLLFHGQNHLEGWGQPGAPDPTLLTITGFNPATLEYKYAVNSHFGRPSSYQAYGQPFQFVLTGRLNVGPSDAAQQLRGLFGGGGGGGGGGGPEGGGRLGGGAGPAGGGGGAAGASPPQSLADDIADRFAQRMPNPFDQILALTDSLALSPEQVTKLQSSSQAFRTRVDSVAANIRAQLKNLGANLDATSMMGIMRGQIGTVRDMVRQAIDEAQHVLTPDQWPKVPDRIKTPAVRGPR
jgi:carboxypeptidase family protein